MLIERTHVNSSKEYGDCRNRLLDAETLLRDQIEEVAALRRALPAGPTVNYTFQMGPARLDRKRPVFDVELAALFGPRHDTLVVYHLMYAPTAESGCPMCSSWIDGINGVAAHLDQHVAFAVVAQAPIATLREWAIGRGWSRVQIASSANTTFEADLRVVDAEGQPFPAMSVFTRHSDGSVEHRYTTLAFLADGGRGLDQMSPIWNILDLTPDGRPEWWPDNDYPSSFRLTDLPAT